MVRFKTFDVINYSFLIVLSASIIIPFLYLISRSLMSHEDILLHGYTLFPKHVVFSSYKYLLFESTFLYRGFANTFFITIVGTFCCLLFTSSLAYGLSKKYLPYRNIFTLLLIITMFFGGGLIPSYLLVTSLGLKNSLWAIIVPALISPWYMFLMRNFFMEIPGEVEESARMDGANDFMILFRIILPMSMPALATIGLFYAVEFWNTWFSSSIYLNSTDKWPVQLILKQMLTMLELNDLDANASQSADSISSLSKDGVKAAAIIITSLPIICVYPFIQKYFVKGLMVGSVKG
ncbi:carbohydrate ABC transporter permease [Paenibacillus koleovorans]|uniref:carbohydrate ABC transporter permease n=1 Tax=Paenibacillus koleovorans TaxID=121608 RepID=UPI000FD819F0|nr:carbohydrate ABC transporter permease [Paenibacillus koleovorans]